MTGFAAEAREPDKIGVFPVLFSGWTAVLDKGRKNSYNDMRI